MSGGVMLFHRDFLGYTGGHGKVWDYFNHALALGWDARVYLAPSSLRDASNPWMAVPGRIEPAWVPGRADVLFLAGMDWLALPTQWAARCPVINLLQHVRHADPALPLRAFLRRPAHRICVSRPVAEAVLATGEVNGPVAVVPAALDLPTVTERAGPASSQVFIGALKAPELGRALAQRLRQQGHVVRLEDGLLPRAEYLSAMAAAQVVVPLPHPTEGLFLPGLEAMALERPLVMPACVGSAEYALDGTNCLMPPPEVDALAAAVSRLLGDPALRARLVTNGRHAVARHTLPAERAAFGRLMEQWL